MNSTPQINEKQNRLATIRQIHQYNLALWQYLRNHQRNSTPQINEKQNRLATIHQILQYNLALLQQLRNHQRNSTPQINEKQNRLATIHQIVQYNYALLQQLRNHQRNSTLQINEKQNRLAAIHQILQYNLYLLQQLRNHQRNSTPQINQQQNQQALDYTIKNEQDYGISINNIKAKDNKQKWNNQKDHNKIILNLDFNSSAFVKNIQIKGQSIQKVIITGDDVNINANQQYLKNYLVQDIINIPIESDIEISSLVVQIQTDKPKLSLDHLIIFGQNDKLILAEKKQLKYVRFRLSQPQDFIFKRKFIEWLSNREVYVKDYYYYFEFNKFQEHLDCFQNEQMMIQFLQHIKKHLNRHCLYKNFDCFRSNSIMNIQFVNLVQLNLRGNQIKNIQALTFLNFPKLNRIDLNLNYIVITKPIRKLYAKLSGVNLRDNPIYQSNDINYIETEQNYCDLFGFIPRTGFNFMMKNKVNRDNQQSDYKKILNKLQGNQYFQTLAYEEMPIKQVKILNKIRQKINVYPLYVEDGQNQLNE